MSSGNGIEKYWKVALKGVIRILYVKSLIVGVSVKVVRNMNVRNMKFNFDGKPIILDNLYGHWPATLAPRRAS
jgi:hypothetical protein